MARPRHAARAIPAVRPPIDAGRLWAAGVATAGVAALTAIVGFLVARAVFGVPVLAPKSDGVWGNANTPTYALLAACAGLVATGIMHLLLRYAPAPLRSFGWVMFLGTAVGIVAPFASGATLAATIVTAVVNLATGIAVWMLVSAAASSALRLGLVRAHMADAPAEEAPVDASLGSFRP